MLSAEISNSRIFANGAITGAFSRLFNDEIHRKGFWEQMKALPGRVAKGLVGIPREALARVRKNVPNAIIFKNTTTGEVIEGGLTGVESYVDGVGYGAGHVSAQSGLFGDEVAKISRAELSTAMSIGAPRNSPPNGGSMPKCPTFYRKSLQIPPERKIEIPINNTMIKLMM